MTTIDIILIIFFQEILLIYAYSKRNGKYKKLYDRFGMRNDNTNWIILFIPLFGPIAVMGAILLIAVFIAPFILPMIFFNLIRKYILKKDIGLLD